MELTEGIKDFVVAVTDLVYARVRWLLARDAPPREYTYLGGFECDAPAYAGGAAGVATWLPPGPRARIKLIDLIAWAPGGVGGFVVDDVVANGESLLVNQGPIPAEIFGPSVIGRGFETRPVDVDPSKPVVVRFHNATTEPTPRPFWVAGKIKSDTAPSTDLPKGDLT